LIEFVGSLNPLKVIADAINDWREQNTRRQDGLLNAEIERERIQAERETSRAEDETARRKHELDALVKYAEIRTKHHADVYGSQARLVEALIQSSIGNGSSNVALGSLEPLLSYMIREPMAAVGEVARDIRIHNVICISSDAIKSGTLAPTSGSPDTARLESKTTPEAHPASQHRNAKVPVIRIGYLAELPQTIEAQDAFRRSLSTRGWIDGPNIAIHWRFGTDTDSSLNPYVIELATLQVAIIAALGTKATEAAQKAPKSIDLVYTSGPNTNDSLASRVADHLDRIYA